MAGSPGAGKTEVISNLTDNYDAYVIINVVTGNSFPTIMEKIKAYFKKPHHG